MHKDDVLKEIFANDPLGILEIKPAVALAKNEDDRLKDAFQEILTFFEQYHREPVPENGIQEFQLYSRLKNLRKQEESHSILGSLDKYELLKKKKKEIHSLDDIFADDSLGVLESEAEEIFNLRHIPKNKDVPDYIARRKSCADFYNYEHLFKQCQTDLRTGKRNLLSFKKEQQIEVGHFFVLKGVLLYVAEVGNREKEKGKTNARLRCIFENGTESDLLLRSLAAELYKDGKRVTENEDVGLNLFNTLSSEDKESGYILSRPHTKLDTYTRE